MRNLFINLNKFFLYLLVITITFENWDAFNFGGAYSITYFASIFYIVSSIPLLRYSFSFTPFKKYFVPLVLFVVVGIVCTALNSSYAPSIIDFLKTRFFQLIIIMILISCQIFGDKDLLWRLLSIYVLSVVVMYFLFILGIGTGFENGRLTIFGENPNGIGMKAVIAFLIVLSNLLENKFSLLNSIFRILLMIMFLNLIILTASRGALFSVFLGITIFVFFIKMSKGQKILLGIIGVTTSLLLFKYIMESNDVFRRRMLATIESGDTGRSHLWSGAFRIIEDNLFTGVGLYGEIPAMQQYAGVAMGVHNTFLWVIMTTGIFGFFFFFQFIIKLGISLFKTYRITGKVLFLVLFLIILFNWAKAGGGINKIAYWFFLAVLIGSTHLEAKFVNTTSSA